MDSADNAGARVSATLRVAIGPNSHVTGASRIPMATTLVLASRFTPTGTCMAVE